MASVRPVEPPPLRLSVIVPFHRNLTQLAQCLAAIEVAAATLPPTVRLEELIVAADGAVDDPAALAASAGALVLVIDGPLGPGVARTRAAAVARGDVLVFVDTDVTVHADAFVRLASHFQDSPDIGAAFGAYDEDPADPGFISQCRNLGHSFVHHRSNREASTFWAGLGAVRAGVFAALGGFDPRFGRPSVEDIDLGYRIRAAGFRIVLDPRAQGKHLKRWTFRSSYVTDIRDRGIPWTQLMKRYGGMQNDLNLTLTYRLCVVVTYLMLLALAAAPLWPPVVAVVPVALVALYGLDWPYYQFFARRRGVLFALRWFPLHVIHHACNGFSFVAGNLLYAGRRWGGITLPGALPLTPWSGHDAARMGALDPRYGVPT